MNKRWRIEILNQLLDKYERTIAYKNGEQPDRRIMLQFYGASKSDFPVYDIDNHFVRTEVNDTVISMQKQGLIDFDWFRGEENHIIKRLWLNMEHIDDAYQAAGRQSAKILAFAVIRELEQEIEMVNTEWIISYYSETKEYIQAKFQFGSRISADEKERRNLYHMLRFIDGNSFTSLTERVFSEKCFGDSKFFETKMKSALLSIMRKYVSREMADAELLQSIGVSRYPEPLEMRGNILVNGNNMGVFESGFCIYSNDIEAVNISFPNTVTKILTIENRANYFAYQQADDELVIYHGGQYSPAKKKLFEKIAAAMPENCVWYHWGDIDLGGFSMLLRLRKEILPSVYPYRMNRNELITFQTFTQLFPKDYAEKLRKLSEQELLSDCRECIDYMLKHQIKLEQEAMLT
ncbi:Wadjet anti-phage system protein JetD domain-containing protein [Lachnoclostridium sp. MSJ-17]|uniref:Wadjet anti-phage system protein JetD domain-containing protein n=1 Tax=Lachnoclostridium sp. MSJ-17 TaxID=2841516 RepID=UPI001C0FD14E|nr:Wadjet anti-phage system protein JetD domain-containing protein [Lachnoclostridium sp. MSJ-17]MBU5462810.1 DUF2220 domain-containing protein [Lachnoclostridium sp. MSJ-17]